MSFSDTVFLFFLALILFGPKKLPEMARQAGKLLAELRRASNEFRSQIETEIAHLEVEKQTSVSSAAASLGTNPAVGESIPHQPESLASLAAPTVEAPARPDMSSSVSETASTEAVTDPNASTSQASHV